MLKILHRAADDRAAFVNDDDLVGDLLHFAKLVGGKENRCAVRSCERDQFAQDLFHRGRIEAIGGPSVSPSAASISSAVVPGTTRESHVVQMLFELLDLALVAGFERMRHDLR